MNPPPPRLSFVYKIEVRKCPVQIMWEEMWVDEQCVVFVISIYYTYYYIYKYIYNFFMLSILLGPRTTNCQNRLIKVHIRCKFQIAFRVFIQTPLAHASQDWRNLHQHFHWQLLCPRKVADVATEHQISSCWPNQIQSVMQSFGILFKLNLLVKSKWSHQWNCNFHRGSEAMWANLFRFWNKQRLGADVLKAKILYYETMSK